MCPEGSHSRHISSPKGSNSSHHPTTTEGGGDTPLLTANAFHREICLANTTPDAAPTNHQYRNSQRSQQSRSSCTGTGRSSTTPCATLSTQPQPREICFPGLHTSRPDQSLLPTTRTPQSYKGKCNPRNNRSGVEHAAVARFRFEIPVEHR